MMMIEPESDVRLRNNPFLISDQLTKLTDQFKFQFKKMMRPYVFFHLLFAMIGIFELIFFSLFYSFLSEYSLGAFALALIFLTTFSYFILRLYYQTRKPEQFKELKKSFSSGAKELLEYQENVPECHAALADAYCRLAESLNGLEGDFYTLPKAFSYFKSLSEKISFWMHWDDVYGMKEIALTACIDEHIQAVKCDATSLEIHTALANAYIMLSGLYMQPQNQEDEDEKRWKPTDLNPELLQQKFRAAAMCAIEEFKILRDYSPNDPWIHEQLAYSYCDLQMREEAIAEYEQILLLNSRDSDILYRLGMLYFQSGKNAQGLRIYHQLKMTHYKKAELLISHYGAYK